MESVALWGVLAALLAVLGAAGTITWLALKVADLKGGIADGKVALAASKVATAEEARERGVAIARAERYLGELTEYRTKAKSELARLRADMEAMRDEPHILDPAGRRARWGRLLAKADSVSELLEHDPGTDGAGAAGGFDVLRGVDGGKSAAAPAGGGADRPGTGRPPA